MTAQVLVDLGDYPMDKIGQWLDMAHEIERNRWDISRSLRGKILCPIFAQESSRTYMNSISSFQKMGGIVSPTDFANTRFGSKWNEPIRDFACLLDSCFDQVVFRSGDMQIVRDLSALLNIPFINAGNGVGIGAEHPMQALVDLYTLRRQFGDNHLRILMIGGAHIRSARTQIKLFLRAGHEVTVMSLPPKVDNSDIEKIIEEQCWRASPEALENWSGFDVIYHNGMDEDPEVCVPLEYRLTLDILGRRGFRGKVMHSLPRKNELMNCVDDTGYNLYFQQMKNSRWVFQSVFWHQHHGFGEGRAREYAAA